MSSRSFATKCQWNARARGRVGLAALLDRLESNGIRVVLVERADRLALTSWWAEVILGRFREIGGASHRR